MKKNRITNTNKEELQNAVCGKSCEFGATWGEGRSSQIMVKTFLYRVFFGTVHNRASVTEVRFVSDKLSLPSLLAAV